MIPVEAKIEPVISELSALKKARWADLLPQSRRAIESAIASLEAAWAAERDESWRRCVAEAAKGEIGPGRGLRVVG